MIALLDTSTPTCRLALVDGETRYDHEWEAGRTLARDLLKWLDERLAEHDMSRSELSGIGAYVGPGSFTGLRIGLTVLNTLAEGMDVPIVGTAGESWQEDALTRLRAGENDRIVLPYYGSEANITTPRK